MGHALIDNCSSEQVCASIIAHAKNRGKPAYVITSNAQHIVLLEKERSLQEIYDDADLVIPDGISLLIAARLYGRSLQQRVAGVDHLQGVVRSRRRSLVCMSSLLGGRPGSARAGRDCTEERLSRFEVQHILSSAGLRAKRGGPASGPQTLSQPHSPTFCLSPSARPSRSIGFTSTACSSRCRYVSVWAAHSRSWAALFLAPRCGHRTLAASGSIGFAASPAGCGAAISSATWSLRPSFFASASAASSRHLCALVNEDRFAAELSELTLLQSNRPFDTRSNISAREVEGLATPLYERAELSTADRKRSLCGSCTEFDSHPAAACAI